MRGKSHEYIEAEGEAMPPRPAPLTMLAYQDSLVGCIDIELEEQDVPHLAGRLEMMAGAVAALADGTADETAMEMEGVLSQALEAVAVLAAARGVDLEDLARLSLDRTHEVSRKPRAERIATDRIPVSILEAFAPGLVIT